MKKGILFSAVVVASTLMWVAIGNAGFIEIVGLDPRSSAMGGAATGVADTPAAWYYNPAGLAQIRGAWQELGLSQVATFNLHEKDSDSGGWVDDTTPETWNVYMPGCDNYGLKDITIGLGGGTTFGGDVYWPQNQGDFRYSGYESTTLVQTLAPTVAYKVNSWFMVGVGANVVMLNKLTNYSKLGDGFFSDAVRGKAKAQLKDIPPEVVDKLMDILGVNSYNGRDDGKFELKTDSEFPTGLQPTNDMDLDFRHLSYNIGFLFTPIDRLRVGVTYREATYLKFEGDARVVLEEDAKGVVNNNPIMVALNGGTIQDEATRWHMAVCMPRELAAGVSYQFTDKLLVAADFQWTNWGNAWQVQTTYLEGNGILGLTQVVTRRDFNDTFSARVGAEYKVWRGLRCQVGYWWDPTPIPNSTLDSGTFDSDRHTFSFGLGYYGLFNGLIDISSCFQYLYFTERTIHKGESRNLGGFKKYVAEGPNYNDFDLTLGGNVVNVMAIVGIHY
jgi:long-chain fatty acid transport protein